jgi:hypothetical protein
MFHSLDSHARRAKLSARGNRRGVLHALLKLRVGRAARTAGTLAGARRGARAVRATGAASGGLQLDARTYDQNYADKYECDYENVDCGHVRTSVNKS